MMVPNLAIVGSGSSSAPAFVRKVPLSVSLDPANEPARPFLDVVTSLITSKEALFSALQESNPFPVDPEAVVVERLMIGPGGGGSLPSGDPDVRTYGGLPGMVRHDEIRFADIPDGEIALFIGVGGYGGDTYANTTEWIDASGSLETDGGVAVTDDSLLYHLARWRLHGHDLQPHVMLSVYSGAPEQASNRNGPGMGGALFERGGYSMYGDARAALSDGGFGQPGQDANSEIFLSLGSGGSGGGDDLGSMEGQIGGRPGGGGGAGYNPGSGADGGIKLRFWQWEVIR